MKISLTHHFIERWKLRVSNGVEPDVKAVECVLAESIRIQKGRRAILVNGKEYKALSLYWHPDLKMVVSIDPVTFRAVSVLTDTMMDGKDKKRHEKTKQRHQHGYVAMTMHGIGGL